MATIMEFAAMQLERDGYNSRADVLGPADETIPERPPILHVRMLICFLGFQHKIPEGTWFFVL